MSIRISRGSAVNILVNQLYDIFLTSILCIICKLEVCIAASLMPTDGLVYSVLMLRFSWYQDYFRKV